MFWWLELRYGIEHYQSRRIEYQSWMVCKEVARRKGQWERETDGDHERVDNCTTTTTTTTNDSLDKPLREDILNDDRLVLRESKAETRY
jgi:hypothetical protein